MSTHALDVGLVLTPEVPENGIGLPRRHDHPEWYQHDALCGAHLVRRMHDAGIKTTAWTVDDSTTMREMINLGVDLITTNDIGTLIEVRNER